ncbi:hypothetical protein RchiOBHm_Chr5g0010431 [Rosa chinensis]|uniref:Uncharacterized protein n=1 Tax=Rosa chinensis TaxID=74649 RepID=A0A2P6Q4L1_ROSCH|nr:hypothetical protein RchiOBHm_Chr5g0010431 [Rosa chinensis]
MSTVVRNLYAFYGANPPCYLPHQSNHGRFQKLKKDANSKVSFTFSFSFLQNNYMDFINMVKPE